MNTATKQIWARRGIVALLLLVLLAAWGLRMRGTEWPLLHPDEYKITVWSAWMEEHTRTFSVTYPGGYFHLIKPLLLLKNAALDARESWRDFLGHGNLPTRPDMVQTFLLRKINVGFALLTVVLFYGLARRITGSRTGALAAAAFLGFSRVHVEHSHYAETDIAMLFTLTLALYLWARVADGRRLGWFLVAALISGVAVGTKYTNLILFVPMIAGIILCSLSGNGSRRGRRLALFVVVGLVAAVTGWLYTNHHVLADADYWSQLRRALHSTYGERTGLLGKDLGDPYGVIRSNWNTLAMGLSEINWIWFAFMAAGLGMAVTSRYRRYLSVTVLPLALYLVYFIKLAPWVRSQEFMVFLPFFAVLIALGVRQAWEWAGRVGHPFVPRVVMVGLLLAASFESGCAAGRFSSLCGWPEPRIQAMNWIYCHAPLTARVGVEDYTVPACRLFGNACEVPQIERVTQQAFPAFKMDYLLRNETAKGRGTVDPRTRDLYPEYAANLLQFRKSARLLCQWGPENPLYAFVGNRIEWWDTRSVSPDLELESPLFRPVRIDELDAIPVPMDGNGVGSAAGMMVDTAPRSFVVSGAGESRRTVYVILQTEERGGTIVVNGMGDRQTVDVPPYSVRVVTVCRPWYWPRLSEYDVITIHSKPHPHIRYLPCFAQVALNPGDVAAILYQKGYPDRALSRLAAVPPDFEKVKWLRYVCAVEQSDWALAERFESAARRSLERFEAARSIPAERLALNGLSGASYLDHARIRLPGLETGKDGIQMLTPPFSARLVKEECETNYTEEVVLPVRLAPGRYSLRGSLTAKTPFVLHPPWTLSVGDTIGAETSSVTLLPGIKSEVVLNMMVTREKTLTLTFTSEQAGGEIEVSDIELRWRGGDVLWPERRELYRALLRHAYHRGDTDAALKLLDKARESIEDGPGWQQVEQSRESIRKESKPGGLVFYPWLKLAGIEATESIARVRFEVIREFAPPLRVLAYRKKWDGPKSFYRGKLALQGKERGSMVFADIPRPKGVDLSDLSIRVESDIEWVPMPLRVRDYPDGRVPLGH